MNVKWMRPSSNTVIVQSLSKAIVEKAVTAAFEELKGKSPSCQTGMEPQVNGKTDFSRPKDTIDLKKILVNGRHEPEAMYKGEGHSMMNGLRSAAHGDKDSDNDSSSGSSDNDSSDSSEPPITTFKADGTPQSSNKKQELPDIKLTSDNKPNSVHDSPKTTHKSPEQNDRAASTSEQAHGSTFDYDLNNNIGITNGKESDAELGTKDLEHAVIKSSLPEANTSGSSDVVFGLKDTPNSKTVNNIGNEDPKVEDFGNVSGGSESKDQNKILAELRKIVEEDQLNDGSSKETSLVTSGRDAGLTTNTEYSVQSTSHNIMNGDSKNDGPETSFEHGSGANHHNLKHHKTSKEDQNFNHDGHNGGMGSHGDGDHSNNHGADVELTKCEKSENGGRKDVILLGSACESNEPATSEIDGVLLKNKESFENIEMKLQQLEQSNTGQSSEIKRLHDVNESLKTKFSELEETSGYHNKLEDQMLKKNEELEKHLLGLLKSQDIIYDLRQKMGTVTAANEKLTQDYQEAVKALEAVDKLFNKKDDLVKKWKDATEESRRLVELLKKHNAEVADLETVDKLKEKIAKLEKDICQSAATNKEHSRRNEELEEQTKAWMKKYELENEERIKMDYCLEEVKKDSKSNQKLAAKRGRKNQMLHLEATELKDMLKLAKDKVVSTELKVKDLEQKINNTQEMYTNIIHEKEKQQSVLLRKSEIYQKDLLAKDQMTENLRTEIDSLKTKIHELETDILATVEKLTSNQKDLETSLKKQEEANANTQKVQSELEKSKIEKVDNDLYIEEQTVQIKELGEQCRDLQEVVKQFILRTTQRPRRRRMYANKSPMSQSMPTYPNLEMYKKLLTPPKPMRSRPHPIHRETQPTHCSDDENMRENNNEVGPALFTSTVERSKSAPSRPRSTYGNRQLSSSHQPDHDTENNKDWLPNVILVDSKKLEASSESGVSADQYAMEYVKVGDRVLIEMPLKGRKQNIPGLVKYVGPVYHKNFKMGIYAGLRLDVPVGDTGGTIGGRMYFQCLPDHGKFIKLSHILAIQNKRTQQYTRIFPLTKSFSGKI